MVGFDPSILAYIGLAHLQESAALTQQRQARIDKLTRQRIEDDINAAATRVSLE